MTRQVAHRDSDVVRGTLELDMAGHSPSGASIAADGRRWLFSGWAELGAALEDWRVAAAAGGAPADGHVAHP